jgi:hypothetical protein
MLGLTFLEMIHFFFDHVQVLHFVQIRADLVGDGTALQLDLPHHTHVLVLHSS